MIDNAAFREFVELMKQEKTKTSNLHQLQALDV